MRISYLYNIQMYYAHTLFVVMVTAASFCLNIYNQISYWNGIGLQTFKRANCGIYSSILSPSLSQSLILSLPLSFFPFFSPSCRYFSISLIHYFLPPFSPSTQLIASCQFPPPSVQSLQPSCVCSQVPPSHNLQFLFSTFCQYLPSIFTPLFLSPV